MGIIRNMQVRHRYSFRLHSSIKIATMTLESNLLYDKYPIMSIELPDYIKQLKKQVTICYPQTKIGKGYKVFEMPYYGLFRLRKYTFIWDEQKLITESKSCPNKLIPLKNNNIFHSKNGLNYKTVKEKIISDWEAPIILGQLPNSSKYVILDGNHRYQAAINRRDDHIEAVLLNQKQVFNSLYDDYFKLLFLVVKNLLYITKPRKYNDFKLTDSLNQEGYYSIEPYFLDIR